MLRLGKLFAESLGMLGVRPVLSWGYQEVRLQGVRSLRYRARERGRREGPAELRWRLIPLGLGGPRLLHLWMALGVVGTLHLAVRQQEMLV